MKQAFVLGAGLGTRLRPMTDRRPKPMVPLYNKPLITFAFDHLITAGVERFVINTHHCSEAYDVFGGDYLGKPLTFRHEPVLLDTGGGIANVRDLLGSDPFFVYNGDVLADLPLEKLVQQHADKKPLATLVLRSSGGPLHIQCDPVSGSLTDIRNTIGGRTEPSFLFTGISLLSPEILPLLPAGGIFSIIPVYLDLIRRGANIRGVVVDEGLWFDLGSRESYLEAHRVLADRPLKYSSPGWPPRWSAPPGVQSSGFCSVGKDVSVGMDVALEDCVIWDGAKVEPGSQLRRCVVRDGMTVTGCHTDAVL